MIKPVCATFPDVEGDPLIKDCELCPADLVQVPPSGFMRSISSALSGDGKRTGLSS